MHRVDLNMKTLPSLGKHQAYGEKWKELAKYLL